MNPYFRPTAAPARAPAPAHPAQSGSFQPTAAAVVSPGQTRPTAQPAYPPTRAALRAAGPSSSINPAAPAAPSPKPGSFGPGVGPVRRKLYDDADRAARAAATRAVPYDLWRPGAGAVRFYPADRHNPKPAVPAPIRRPSLMSELRHSTAAVPSNSFRLNRPPSSGPVRPRAYNPYQPAAAAAAATAPAPAPAPAGHPPTAELAQNTYIYYPADPRRR